ncbi:hypothetical protein T05_8896 [Trichinella murrelli]|uniref:Uncharacterized protein n=1 Tax=Trichinella murrelli TaxID=144512 RepID=A0A0V0UCN5_9BILA|nr:hypothetical protein T05_8896 [Trichinella murrelli]
MFKNPELSQNKVKKLLTVDDATLFKALTDDENIQNSGKRDKPNEVLSHSKTYSCLEVTFKWMEQQKEFSATHLMLIKLMCDAAAQKKLSSFKKNDEYDTK